MQKNRGVHKDSIKLRECSYIEQILPVIKESEMINISVFSGQGPF